MKKSLGGGRRLRRVKALKDFGTIKAGDLGGWVQGEHNLSQDGLAWISGNAKVYDQARVHGDAVVTGSAEVYNKAIIYGDSRASGEAMVSGNARIGGNAWICGSSAVHGDVEIDGEVLVSGSAQVLEEAKVSGDLHVNGNMVLCADACVSKPEQIQSLTDGKRSTTYFLTRSGRVVGFDGYNITTEIPSFIEDRIVSSLSNEVSGDPDSEEGGNAAGIRDMKTSLL